MEPLTRRHSLLRKITTALDISFVLPFVHRMNYLRSTLSRRQYRERFHAGEILYAYLFSSNLFGASFHFARRSMERKNLYAAFQRARKAPIKWLTTIPSFVSPLPAGTFRHRRRFTVSMGEEVWIVLGETVQRAAILLGVGFSSELGSSEHAEAQER